MEDPRLGALSEYASKLIRHKARKLVGSYGFTWSDSEDLEQDMMLALLLRLPKYDSNKASLGTFISRIVDRSIATMLRHRKRAKRDYRCNGLSLDEPIGAEDGTTRGDLLSQDERDLSTGRRNLTEEERNDMRLDIARVLSGLPPGQRVLAKSLQNQSVAEVARDRGVPRTTLHGTVIARLREIFEDEGLRVYL